MGTEVGAHAPAVTAPWQWSISVSWRSTGGLAAIAERTAAARCDAVSVQSSHACTFSWPSSAPSASRQRETTARAPAYIVVGDRRGQEGLMMQRRVARHMSAILTCTSPCV